MSDAAQPRLSRKNALMVALAVTCTVIWGRVLYQVATGLDPVEQPALVLPVAAPGLATDGEAVIPIRQDQFALLDSAFRDPFQPPAQLLPRPTAPRTSRRRVPSEPNPLSLSLQGVIDDTALLQDENGVLHFAHTGDRIGTAQVLRIEKTQVVVRHAGRTTTLPLR